MTDCRLPGMVQGARNHRHLAPLSPHEANKEHPVKQVAIITLAACSFIAGCASYTERVVEKPVPARTSERTVVYDTTPAPAQTTTVYTTR
jgi:hypothetical protein